MSHDVTRKKGKLSKESKKKKEKKKEIFEDIQKLQRSKIITVSNSTVKHKHQFSRKVPSTISKSPKESKEIEEKEFENEQKEIQEEEECESGDEKFTETTTSGEYSIVSPSFSGKSKKILRKPKTFGKEDREMSKIESKSTKKTKTSLLGKIASNIKSLFKVKESSSSGFEKYEKIVEN